MARSFQNLDLFTWVPDSRFDGFFPSIGTNPLILGEKAEIWTPGPLDVDYLGSGVPVLGSRNGSRIPVFLTFRNLRRAK